MKHFVATCPACRERLQVSTLTCTACDTTVEGQFSIPSLLDLGPDELDFLMLFLKTWGNLSEMAKLLGISYPTVRSRYEQFLKRVGIEPAYSKNTVREILDLLDNGDIDASEALKRFKKMK